MDFPMSSQSGWYFSKETITRGKKKEELFQEGRIRRKNSAFIQEVGVRLQLKQLVIATSIVFTHRFFFVHKFEEFDNFIIATACLFLATKVEESPRNLNDVTNAALAVNSERKSLLMSSQTLEELRESILHHEFLILKTLGFDFYVEHPYPYLLNYMNRLQGTQSLAQTAWSFVNDSLRTTLSLQFEPRVIASGAIYLASKYLKYNLPEGTSNGVSKPWWESLNVKFEDLQEISNQILDLYELSYEKEVSDAVVSERSFGSKETETSLSAKESSSIITDPTAIVPIVVVEPTDTCDHRNGDLTTTKTTTTTTMTTNTTNGNIGGDGIHNTTVTNGNNDSNVGNGILPIVKASNCFSACFHCNLRSLTEKYPIEAITTSETSATVQITSIAEEISNSNGKNGIGTSPVMISSTKIPLASNECQPIKKRRKLTEDLSNTIPCESSSPSSSSSSLSPPKLPQEEYAPDQCISMPKEEEPLESLIDAQSVQDRDPKSPNPFHLGKTSPSIEVEEGEILPNRLEDGMRSVSSSSSAAFITSSAVSHGSLLENSVSLVCESRLDSTDCKDVFGACGGPLSSSASLAGRRFHPY